MKNELKLIRMSEVHAEEVQWLWYPYIPLGKLTIVQGDPGEGKTTFVLSVISSLTRGVPLPECSGAESPMNVIYQTAEDGLADTIKPRLEAMGADCSRVFVIDESRKDLSLMDERLEKAIRETGAQLIVLDPLQAYLGRDVDMHRANEIRPIMKRVAAMAQQNNCAVILIGHMNKAQGLKSGYRGLGSIDFRAAARSILLIGRTKDEPTIRIVAQDKNSLAPEGRSMAFELKEISGFRWLGYSDATVDDVLSGMAKSETKTSHSSLCPKGRVRRVSPPCASQRSEVGKRIPRGSLARLRQCSRQSARITLREISSLLGGLAERLSDVVGQAQPSLATDFAGRSPHPLFQTRRYPNHG